MYELLSTPSHPICGAGKSGAVARCSVAAPPRPGHRREGRERDRLHLRPGTGLCHTPRIALKESPMQRFMRRPKHLLLGVALPLFCLASAASVRADSKVYQDVLHSTGLVEVPHPEGRITYGTCWLVDEHGLALTGQHVVKDAVEVVVYFPAYRDGTAIPELAHYHRHVAAVHGRVVHRDTHRISLSSNWTASRTTSRRCPWLRKVPAPVIRSTRSAIRAFSRVSCGATPPGKCARCTRPRSARRPVS